LIQILTKKLINRGVLLNTFGERFKALRIKKDLTQHQLVESFNQKFNYNITKSAISQYENNKRIPEVNLLIDLAKYFQVSLDYLLCIDSLIAEDIAAYNILKVESTLLSLEKIIDDVILLIRSQSKISLDGICMTKKQKDLFINCLQIGFELSKNNENQK